MEVCTASSPAGFGGYGAGGSWTVLSTPSGMDLPSGELPPRPAAMAAELQQRVTMFHAGDEKYSGEWLTNFQRADCAWNICVEALRPGPLPSCDEELLQDFTSQTLGRLARAFGVRFQNAEARKSHRDELEALLALHAHGRATTWRQLCLALTCADLWCSSWSPDTALSAPSSPLAASGLPRVVQRELLTLPVELLFCDRALPLDDPKARYAAAGALLDACPRVLPFLLGADPAAVFEGPLAMEGEEGRWLEVLASWLRAARKCLRQLPARDEIAPLRCLAEHGERLIVLVASAPKEAAEVAEEIAKWRGSSPKDVAQLLDPILQCLFTSYYGLDDGRLALLPLLTELASDLWPRAAFGDVDLNWPDIAEQAVEIAKEAIQAEDAGPDVEAALAVWQQFAMTVSEGVKELPGPPELEEVPVAETDPGSRPEKRRREGTLWCPTAEQIAQADALPQLFSGLARQLLELLVAPIFPEEEALTQLWTQRQNAQSVLEAWAPLVGAHGSWHEATWAPLTRIGKILLEQPAESHDDDVWREAEVVFWFSSALAASWPENAGSVPVSTAVSQLHAIDAAPTPWRALLWTSGAGLAATAPAEQCAAMLEWMLMRSPMAADSLELLMLLELPYAQALEKTCRNLPNESKNVNYGERLAALAFAERPPEAVHDDTTKAQMTILMAMRYALGTNTALLCQGLATAILPALQAKVKDEMEEAQMYDGDSSWLSAQALFATLSTAIPLEGQSAADNGSSGVEPAVEVWKANWSFVKDALLTWKPSSSSDQPRAAAVEALTTAVLALPPLLGNGVQLLTQSAVATDLPDLQLKALRDIVMQIKPASPEAASQTAQVLNDAVLGACDKLLLKPQELLDSPETLCGFFGLLSEAIRSSPPGTSGLGPCDDRLRPLLLSQPLRFTGRGLELVARALPDCTRADASGAMLRFVARILSPEDGAHAGAHKAVLMAALSEICCAVCKALASQQHLIEDLEALVPAAEALYVAADVFPAELPTALSLALQRVQIPEWSRSRMLRHVAGRADWKRRSEWLEHLSVIVQEWQNELRHVQL
eukprot:TRINITY_DN4079_c0_g1_i1.p1 TRINITY_DN4079_c0_g1~~TRINITY_DN4079_c0_g1_i1.p1  ORF type:complete len:1058 (+),score=286.40 TRINITY_DN4079_c0_g1_i1:104-3277(+)